MDMAVIPTPDRRPSCQLHEGEVLSLPGGTTPEASLPRISSHDTQSLQFPSLECSSVAADDAPVRGGE